MNSGKSPPQDNAKHKRLADPDDADEKLSSAGDTNSSNRLQDAVDEVDVGKFDYSLSLAFDSVSTVLSKPCLPC